MLRAFIAIPLPDDLKAQLDCTQRDLKALLRSSTVRWTPSDQMHLTLRFLGDIAEPAVGELSEALRGAVADVAPFELQARGMGCFPSARNARVLWAGVEGDLAVLRRLQRLVETACGAWGQPEHRDYQAHLTLGRAKQLARQESTALADYVRASEQRALGRWQVTECALMRSILAPQGSQHSTLAAFALGAKQMPPAKVSP